MTSPVLKLIQSRRTFVPEGNISLDLGITRWLIYAFQLLGGTDVDDGWTPLHRLHNAVWKHAGGILQADGEGFCDVEYMGVLKDGRWVHFEMDLGNELHRKEFLSGQVPLGAKVVH